MLLMSTYMINAQYLYFSFLVFQTVKVLQPFILTLMTVSHPSAGQHACYQDPGSNHRATGWRKTHSHPDQPVAGRVRTSEDAAWVQTPPAPQHDQDTFKRPWRGRQWKPCCIRPVRLWDISLRRISSWVVTTENRKNNWQQLPGDITSIHLTGAKYTTRCHIVWCLAEK